MILLSFSSCVSQDVIERACYQTLSASTPVCMCNETVSTPIPPEFVITAEGDTISTPTAEEMVPEQAFPLSDGTLIFSADFETGDLSTFETDDAEYFGKGSFYACDVVSQPAIGNHSAALTIGSGDTTAAYLFVYKVPASPLGIYSADFYIPGNILTSDWWNVWQWKSEDNNYEMPVISLNLISRGPTLFANLFYTPGGSAENESVQIIQSDPIPFPADQWVNITGRYLASSDTSGYVEIYQDGTKIFDIKNIQTQSGGARILWSVNSYADRIAPDPATIYVDNIKIYEAR